MDNKILTGPPVPSLPPKPVKLTPAPASTPISTPTLAPTPKPQPALVAPVVAKPVQSESDGIVIHTMQDDLSAIQRGQKMPTIKETTPTPASASPQGPIHAVDSTQPAKTLPLPPKGASNSAQKIVLPPQKTKKPSMVTVLLFALVAVVIIGAIGAGVWWWMGMKSSSKSTGQVASAAEVIPANTNLVIQYRIGSTDDRTAIVNAWQKASGTSSMANLLHGDPTLVLQDATVNEFYYVLLPNDDRPYFVIPKTDSTAQMFKSNSEARFTEKNGWYIANSVGTDSYTDSLTQKTLAMLDSSTILATTTENTPLRIIVGAGSLLKWREALGGSSFANGQIQELSIAGRFVASGNGLELAGKAVPLHVPAAGQTSQDLLSVVPSGATFVRLGANFSEDLNSWAKAASALDSNSLSEASVQSLLSQLTTPYAFFISTNDNNHSYGLVITLPPNATSLPQMGDRGLETGLSALIPLLTGRQSLVPLAFNEGSRNNIPLRYVNLTGTASALDYAVTDKYIIIATSKDAMFGSLDALAGNPNASLDGSAGFSKLLSLWGALPASRDIAMGMLNVSNLKELLPIDSNSQAIPFGLAFNPSDDGSNLTIQGIVQLFSGDLFAPAETVTPSSDLDLVD